MRSYSFSLTCSLTLALCANVAEAQGQALPDGGATWVLTGVAFIQAVLFLWLLLMIKRSLSDAARAAESTQKAAAAMADTVAAVTGTAQRQLRAYLGIEFKGIANHPDTSPGWFRVLARNDGQTPALKVSVTMQLQVLPTAALESFTFPEGPDGDQTGMIFIPAKGERRIVSRVIEPSLTPRQVAEISAGANERGDIRLCCWGVARYWDVFDKPRWTRFCFLYGGALSERKRKRAIRFHRHNDTSDAPDPTLPPPSAASPTLVKS